MDQYPVSEDPRLEADLLMQEIEAVLADPDSRIDLDFLVKALRAALAGHWPDESTGVPCGTLTFGLVDTVIDHSSLEQMIRACRLTKVDKNITPENFLLPSGVAQKVDLYVYDFGDFVSDREVLVEFKKMKLRPSWIWEMLRAVKRQPNLLHGIGHLVACSSRWKNPADGIVYVPIMYEHGIRAYDHYYPEYFLDLSEFGGKYDRAYASFLAADEGCGYDPHRASLQPVRKLVAV